MTLVGQTEKEKEGGRDEMVPHSPSKAEYKRVLLNHHLPPPPPTTMYYILLANTIEWILLHVVKCEP